MAAARNRNPSAAWILEQIRRLVAARPNPPPAKAADFTDLREWFGPQVFRGLISELMRLPQLRNFRLGKTATAKSRTAGDLLLSVCLSMAQDAAPSARKKTAPVKRAAGKSKKALRNKPAKKKGKRKRRYSTSSGAEEETVWSRTAPSLLEAPSPVPPPSSALPRGDLQFAMTSGRRAIRQGILPEPTGPAAPAAPDPGGRRPSRYANAMLTDTQDAVLDPRKSLEAGKRVRLQLDIGPLSALSQVANAEPIPDDKLPGDIWLDVVVSSTDFAVAAPDGPGNGRTASGRFFLPAGGGSATNPEGGKYLIFGLVTPASGGGPARARIGYYYRNILVQSQVLTAAIGSYGGFTIETDYTQSADLTGLDDIPERPRLSVLTNANGGGGHQIVLRHPGTPSNGADPATTIAIKDDNVAATIAGMRKALEQASPEKCTASRAELEAVLRSIATLGRQLYNQLPGQKEFGFFVDLYENPEKYVLQVARPSTSDFTLPWSFIYEIPLTTGATPALCKLVADWDGKAPLFQGMPRQCPHGPHASDVLCPFGFWGFRYTIEQLSSTDTIVKEIAAPADSEWVIGKTQFGIDLPRLADHVAKLRALLTAARPQAALKEGVTGAQLQDLLGRDLPFVYLFCHGNKRNVVDPNTWLAVGNNEPITASDVIGWPQIWWSKLRKIYWQKVRPLIFINACHSLAIEPTTLVSYLDAFVGRGGAAGVIGTEIKVSQTVAMDVGRRFFEAWTSGATVEAALRAIRMDYLRQGNLFGLVYTPYCWSELHLA